MVALRVMLAALCVASAGIGTSAHAISVPGQGSWQATLQARDLDGDRFADAYYDTALNITWLANNALEADSSTGAFRTSHYAQTTTWVNTLSINGISGWRLPSVQQDLPAVPYAGPPVDPSTSEMAHLFYVTFGNAFGCADSQSCNFGPLSGRELSLFSGYVFTSTPVIDRPGQVWTFAMFNGVQGYQSMSGSEAGHIAVHDGDVGVSLAVPEPATASMLAAGMVALFGAAWRRSAARPS